MDTNKIKEPLRVLIGCEFSGVVRDAFRRFGHDAYSCDIIDTTSTDKTHHLKSDIFDVIESQHWDVGIFFPPCTYICNSGVCHLYKEKGRWGNMVDSSLFFKKLLNSHIKKIAIENPIPHRYALSQIGRKYDQIIQPWYFGHPEQKSTCLWLKNLPKLRATNIYRKYTPNRLHNLPPSKDRSMLRSITYTGIACAMVLQWSNPHLYENDIII